MAKRKEPKNSRGSSADRTFTAEEQAAISAQYPNIEWVNGKPYTRESVTDDPDGDGLDYLGRS